MTTSGLPAPPRADRPALAGRDDVATNRDDRAFRVLCDSLNNGLMITSFDGEHLYSNRAFDDIVATRNLAHGDFASPPSYVPRDQHRQFWQAIANIESGATSTSSSIELHGKTCGRVLVLFTVVGWNWCDRNTVIWVAHEAYECINDQRIAPTALAMLGEASLEAIFNESGAADSTLAHALSKREHEIVGELLEGRRVNSVARRLNVSEHTVRNHLTSIFRKLGVHSQDELIDRFRKVRIADHH